MSPIQLDESDRDRRTHKRSFQSLKLRHSVNLYFVGDNGIVEYGWCIISDADTGDAGFGGEKPQSWVSAVILDTSDLPLVRREHITNFTGKKRAFEAGRQESNTRIGPKRIHLVRTRGGNRKFRALRLDSGNFSWASEGIARKVRVIVVAFHPSNNELVRTNTLTKSAVVQVDAAPFRQWYEAHYGQTLGRRRQQKAGQEVVEPDKKKSKSVEKKHSQRFAAQGKVDIALEKQFEAGRLFAVIASRPGQSGRVDGYILEGEELAFYQRQLRK
ncbi:hypothetical protein B7494_g5476 [Chlorociboria aeruginascens]|nr:hypothetical protein B7494_g5476 [Chlorociboria aeruginascens]